MLVCTNGVTRGYFYEEGYIRTSSKEYSISNNKLKNKFVHLTNDAIQKTSSDYGRFETGNKLTYKDFQDFIEKSDEIPERFKRVQFTRDILPQIEHLVQQSFRSVVFTASGEQIDPKALNF